MSDDLIRREDLFELMMRHKPIDNGDGSKERYAYIEWLGIYHAIRGLPSADRPQEWIPCSERLPEETADYLCWVINPHDESIQYHMICTYYVGAKKWCPIDETASDNVVAWMPLPKPWKGSDDE